MEDFVFWAYDDEIMPREVEERVVTTPPITAAILPMHTLVKGVCVCTVSPPPLTRGQQYRVCLTNREFM